MSPAVRFLVFVIGGWIALRSLSPLYDAVAADRPANMDLAANPSVPAIVPSELGRIERFGGGLPDAYRPSAPSPYGQPGSAYPQAYGPAPYGYGAPYGYAPSYAAPPQPIQIVMPASAPQYSAPPMPAQYTLGSDTPEPLPPAQQTPLFNPYPPLGQWSQSSLPQGATTVPQLAMNGVSAPVIAAEFPGSPAGTKDPRKIEKWELAMWAMMRDRAGEAMGLANAGVLDASQAGFRVSHSFNGWLFGNLRMSGPISTVEAGGEVAAGVGLRVFPRVPINLMVERRQKLGATNGRNAFAVLVEGGVWQKPTPLLGLKLDAYAQAGVVGFRSRDWFIDGQTTFTKPIFKKLSAGFGVWGGAQPDLYRLDAGPRVSMRIGPRMAVHLDYRHQMIGNAYPKKGAAITLAGDF